MSLEKAIQSRKVSDREKRLIAEVPSIRAFATEHGLKPTRNFRSYVQWDGPAVVWVVSASERLQFKRKEFKFPVVGAMPYISWFDRRDADTFAQRLEHDENLDVEVRGAPAYSTLGWFDDPIVSTMFPEGAEFGDAVGDFASTVFHESVHATHYLKGWGQWNESIAERIAEWLTPRYLAHRFGAQSSELKAYLEGESRAKAYSSKLAEAYRDLDALYRSDLPPEAKQAKKMDRLARLMESLPSKRPLNNASLLQAKAYGLDQEERAAWESLYKKCGENVGKLLERVSRIDPKRDWAELSDGESILPNLALITDC
jgi:predicted aminopeptidase